MKRAKGDSEEQQDGDGDEKSSKQVKVLDASSCAIEEIEGDLFSVTDANASFCHCVSEDLAMSKGIAVEFRNRFGKIAEMRKQQAKVGQVAIIERPGGKDAFVYALITKAKYFYKPTLKDLERSLVFMRDHACSHGVMHICMPKIGCGLDKLRWGDVKRLLLETFSPTGMKISVYTTKK